MDRGFHFGFEGCGGGLVVVLSLRRDGTYTVSPSEPRKESPSEPRLSGRNFGSVDVSHHNELNVPSRGATEKKNTSR